MTFRSRSLRATSLVGAFASLVFGAGHTQAAAVEISDIPVFLQDSVAPLNLLVLGRDHKLYYEAYNDHADLTGDGVPDVGYKPGVITYYGYFDSLKCYSYDSGVFVPQYATADRKCPTASGEWSGDWLNYITTSRIDALRKVLYGGKRSTDTSARTILERSHVPHDAHSWGKEYNSVATDGYDIRDYTSLSLPTAGTRRHLFANLTPMASTTAADNWLEAPQLRVISNINNTRIWQWVSVESPVAGKCTGSGLCSQVGGLPTGDTGGGTQRTFDTYLVRVEVCKNGLLELNCRKYPDGNSKPIGLLQEYGEGDDMLFGLMTGSYQLSKSGGVLRKDVDTITDEVNVTTDGAFTAKVGIIRTIDNLKAAGFTNYRGNAWYRDSGRGAGVAYSPGLVTDRPFKEGEFGGMWGNPIAEMMYEGLRYFTGKPKPTDAYNYSGSSFDSALKLPKVDTWTNPYRAGRPVCAKPFELVMSDINSSYDTDQLPGVDTNFVAGGGISNDLNNALSVSAVGKTIWDTEIGGSGTYFIGQSGATYDGAPTEKSINSFGSIRGLAPEEPTKEGGYYAASVAYHGLTHDVNNAAGKQNVQTFAVALASPLPRVELTVGTGKLSIIPFGKSVGPSNYMKAAAGQFQPTNQIVDYYIESQTATGGTFQVNFEDVEAGNDHDMDAIVRYTYSVSGNQVTITASSDYAAGGIIQHMGYVVSGSTHDGIYLVVRDQDTNANDDIQYFLDTPPLAATPGACSAVSCARLLNGGTGVDVNSVNAALPLTSTRTFTVDAAGGATLLKDPLWYAAKWGGFKDVAKDKSTPADGVPNGKATDPAADRREWDANGDGTPDNYFLVTNALTLGTQLDKAFRDIMKAAGSASSASVNSGSISSETRVYQAKFNTVGWAGELLAYGVDPKTGKLDTTFQWNAADKIPAFGDRKIITVNSNRVPVPFRWTADATTGLDNVRKAQIQPNMDATAGGQRLDYLRGDRSREGTFRERTSLLGDIVSSSPIFVGRAPFFYRDNLELTTKPYSKFKADSEKRTQVVYAGANDGMLHAFDATSGVELMSFIPSTSYRNLASLSTVDYAHKFFVDGAPNMGDVFYNGNWHTMLVGGLNKGGQGIYALNVTDPSDFKEANAANIVKWEFTDFDNDSETGPTKVTGDADLGYTYSQPAIVKLSTGKWAAIFGNGYNNTEADGHASTTGNAVLYVVDIETGYQIAKLDTGVGTAQDPKGLARPNGLSTPAGVDINGDTRVDYVYAGDLFGNMWKFDLKSATVDSWKIAYDAGGVPKPLFVAQTVNAAGKITVSSIRQPITSRPEVIRGPKGVGMMVLFGTGKFLGVTDKVVDTANPEPQYYYGVFDRNSGANSDQVTVEDMLKQTITAEGEYEFTDKDDATVKVKHKYRLSSQLDLTAGQKGWFLPLISPVNGYEGERQVSNTTVRAGRVIFTTLIPDVDPCAPGGSSWLMEMDALTGSRLDDTPFDLNGDGVFDDDDKVEITVDGVKVKVPVSGIDTGVGISPEPGILMGENGAKEYKYTPGTTGEVSVTVENPGPRASGRQSWRQVR